MEIEELLAAIGVDASQAAKVKELVAALAMAATKAATEVDKVKSNLALDVGAMMSTAATKVFEFINACVAGAKALAQEKGLLFNITQKELAQADEYQAVMKKTGLSIESIKTKIVLNLLPQITSATQGFNDWLESNKALIAEGLTQIIQWGNSLIQMVVNTIKVINKIVEGTIGWENAILVVITLLAIFKRAMIGAFISNPITWIMAAIVGLMLLFDDLMVYLEGGESLFGDFWGPAIEWVKSVIAWWNKFYAENKAIFEAIGAAFKQAFSAIMSIFAGVVRYLFNAIKLLAGIFTNNTELMKEAWRGLADSVIQIWDGIVAGLEAICEILVILFDALISVLVTLWEGIKSAVGLVVEWIKEKALQLVSALIAIFKRIDDYIIECFLTLWDTISAFFGNIIDKAKSLIKQVTDILVNVFDTIKKALSTAFNWLSTTIGGFVSQLSTVFEPILDFILSPFTRGIALVKSLFDIFNDDSTSFTEKLEIAFATIKDYLFAPFQAGWELIKDIFNLSDGDIGQFVDDIGDAISNVTDLIIQPFKAALDWVKEKFDWVIKAVVSGFKKLTGSEDTDTEEDDTELTEQERAALNAQTKNTGGIISEGLIPVLNNLIEAINRLLYLPENMNALIANAQTIKHIYIQMGNTTINQNIVSNDPHKAASLSADTFNKTNKLTYQNLTSFIA